jgi:topoisomerase-4 subunit A
MAKKSNLALVPGAIEPVDFVRALEDRYLAYALSTIMNRALPDVRDGLKPVHRRLLYAMRELNLNPNAAFKKSARVVGDVIGKFHPHGDQSVYDALVRLAQGFAQRYPLVDGQGNFGNIDGDNPAAMRYTEARLTPTAAALLEGLDEDAVDFRDNYDGSESEPVVLPAAFPNLLANGSSGIAVGMATSIPPHNASELIQAALYLIDHPKATTAQLMKKVPGPDFPTGGILTDTPDVFKDAYNTGRGSFRLRARWHKEEQGRGTYIIVVTEIPYSVSKSRLVERLAELITDKKLPVLEDVRDESTEDIRLVLEPKNRNIDPQLLMETLFKLSELETRIQLNMNVLAQGQQPMVLGLGDVLLQWLAHRRDVLLRRTKFRESEIERRLEILDGYLIVYLNLDKVIKIIRKEDEPKPVLIKAFKLTDIQADAILNMRLRSLRKLEEIEISREHDNLTKELKGLKGLLRSEDKQWDVIRWQLGELAKQYGKDNPLGKRRTTFEEMTEQPEIDMREAMVEREPITVIMSQKGWVRAMKGHDIDLSSLTYKEGDALGFALPAQTTDMLLVFATNGKFYSLDAAKLPGGRGHGEPVRLMLDLEQGVDVVELHVHNPEAKLVIASSAGNGFIIEEKDAVANTRKGKQVMNLKEGEVAVALSPLNGDHLAVVGTNRKLLVFPLADLPIMPRGKGVRLMKFKDAALNDIKTFNLKEGLTYSDSAGRVFEVEDLKHYQGDRAQAGRVVPRGFPKTNKFSNS